jgi:hypothetical protein
MGDDDPGRHGHLRLRRETLGYNPTYGNGQCTDWAERQFHAWTGTYINTLGINGHSGLFRRLLTSSIPRRSLCVFRLCGLDRSFGAKIHSIGNSAT